LSVGCFFLRFCQSLAFRKKPAERSLLYWRYLCRDEAQEEIIQNGEREFKCVTQNWVVKTAETNGIVKEIIDESP
jgi:hypothetical protein